MDILTVVVPRDPMTGDLDLAAPALFYSAEGYYIGSRKLALGEIRRMNGRQTAKIRISPPTTAAGLIDAMADALTDRSEKIPALGN